MKCQRHLSTAYQILLVVTGIVIELSSSVLSLASHNYARLGKRVASTQVATNARARTTDELCVDLDAVCRQRRDFLSHGVSMIALSSSLPAVSADHPSSDSSSSDVSSLGPLASLVGTWTGNQGLNIVAVPSRNSKPGDTGRFELSVRPYREVLTFSKLHNDDAVRNRGGDLDQFVGALEYRQEVYATDNKEGEDEELIHVENGMMFYLENIQPYKKANSTASVLAQNKPKYSIARSATIPHGNSALLLGTSKETYGPPTIPTINSLPLNIGPKAPKEYSNPYQKPINVVNPNVLLQGVVAKQQRDIRKTVHLSFDSGNEGSSINSIPFLVDRTDSTKFVSDFWLETLKDGSQQLQYSQTIDLAFHKPIGGGNDERIQWPHVTINTLAKTKK